MRVWFVKGWSISRKGVRMSGIRKGEVIFCEEVKKNTK